jgi:protein-arginine kinase activator protein McsA
MKYKRVKWAEKEFHILNLHCPNCGTNMKKKEFKIPAGVISCYAITVGSKIKCLGCNSEFITFQLAHIEKLPSDSYIELDKKVIWEKIKNESSKNNH